MSGPCLDPNFLTRMIYFEIFNLKKKSADDKKHAELSNMQRVNISLGE